MNMKLHIALMMVAIMVNQVCFALKVVMMPQFGQSHFLVMQKLADRLVARGHQVSILVGEEGTYAVDKPNAKIFKLTKDFLDNHKWVREVLFNSGKLSEIPTFIAMKILTGKQKTYCDLFLSDQAMLNELKTADVLVGDSLYPCSSLAADLFDIRHVVVHLMGHVGIPQMHLFGITNYPSYVPQFGSLVPSHMTLLDKMKNLKTYLLNLYVVESSIYPAYNELKIKHHIKPDKNIRESMATVDLILLEKDFILQYAQSLPPYVKEVGSFMASPAQPLPVDLEEFMQSSGDHGVILVSFGSMVDSFKTSVLKVMNEAFSKVPQKVIWRLNIKSVDFPLANNIKVSKWLPQNDILGHRKTRLFVTHGGANGVAEAVYHGVPMLCSPTMSDQFDNSLFVQGSGLGKVSDVKTSTTEQLVKAIQSIIVEKGYHNRCARLSKAMKMRPRSPIDEAADLIEYVHAVGSLSHLKPLDHSLHWYQVYMLDVVCVLAVVLCVVLALITACVRRVLCPAKSHEKTKTS